MKTRQLCFALHRPPAKAPYRRIKVEALGDMFNKRTVPYLRLKGKWLREAGFVENTYVKVTVLPYGLLIEPDD